MYMSYTKNPYMPKVRQEAIRLVYRGWSTRKVGRHFGVGSSTISKWMKKDRDYGARPILTGSSRPHHHPHELPQEIVEAIIAQRKKHRRCAEVIHEELRQQGIVVSLSSVKRVLKRHYLLRERSSWKRLHRSDPRPHVENSGDLVQLDTVHVLVGELYVYTLLDVSSRWAFAHPSVRINTHRSLRFVREAQRVAPFAFTMLQSDHGSEFSTWFSEHVKQNGCAHRHSRVRKPNDNAHLERFNRTLQEECLHRVPTTLRAYRREIPEYLRYYNEERLHLGLDLKTPLRCVQAID